MKCYKCDVEIMTKTNICPLCKNKLENQKCTNEDEVFPYIPIVHKGHGIFLKIMALIFFANTVICMIVNLMTSKAVTWAWIVLAANICVAWSLGMAIKKRHHFARLMFSEYFFIIVSSMLWDYFTGWHLWSLDYVLPLVSMIYIYICFILRLFFPYQLKNYFMNIVFACMIGLVPVILLTLDIMSVKWTAYVSAITSVVMLFSLLVFDGKKIKKECETRFHV